MATFAVGDIQGCYDQLRRLLDKAAFTPETDRLWCVGDMINRGPQSLQTLRFLKSLGTSVVAVLGNHDLHFLAVASGAFRDAKVNTMQDLMNAPDCIELFDWVRTRPLAYNEKLATQKGDKDFLMVHAGIPPNWTFEKAVACSKEVEEVLQGTDFIPFLERMYGDQPDVWDDKLTGTDRLRVITNILTRIRFCTLEGRMNLKIKTSANTAPANFQPWYNFQKLPKDRIMLFGHWATLEGHTGISNIHALDTGCVWRRCMTLMRLEDGERISVSCNDV
ncbi:MAG: symmetrical bis(5'-nucleosyl)-tetraphosphatase [Pseudomonadota bacterium]